MSQAYSLHPPSSLLFCPPPQLLCLLHHPINLFLDKPPLLTGYGGGL
ncbi:hypothetical protein SLEP1_g10819 [Rubroshorea leprosula]|uniref:Uncharacterized protein n=1 Tax=Rubroshorea leprosula TaxID=152421 RepID=A0AAV5IIR0_9ROSI|nr:hypothetical protein SLEP1_g10819 [Rubroshorea leprosula]